MKKFGIMVIAMALLTACSCRFSLSVNNGFEGHWHAEFNAIYIGIIIPESDSVLSINHTSDMYFENGKFEVILDPPAPPLLGGTGEYNSYWTGNYVFSKDTLIMADDFNNDIVERYNFKVKGDTLSLSYVPVIAQDQDGQPVVEMPLYGGLPWGRAFMWHAGDFYREQNR